MLSGRGVLLLASLPRSCLECAHVNGRRELFDGWKLFHTTCGANWSPHSGDRGPERNFKKNLKKKMKKDVSGQPLERSKLMEDMKVMESRPKVVSDVDHSGVLKSVLKDMKVFVPTNIDVRRKLGMPSKVSKGRTAAQSKGRGSKQWLNFMDPTVGKRLGLFNQPSPGTRVMPTQKPTFEEEDQARAMESLLEFKYRNQFELVMDETRYPRRFPVDNMDYESEEHDVGFQDHVLLDHYLEGFPKRGPVRHFMELVIVGLSKSPHYTSREKKACVEWYRDYFSQNSPEEMEIQTPLSPDKQ